jgi:hypothetical protein
VRSPRACCATARFGIRAELAGLRKPATIMIFGAALAGFGVVRRRFIA